MRLNPKDRIAAAAVCRKTDILPVGFKATDDVLDRLKSLYAATDIKNLIELLPVDTYGNFNNAFYGVYPEYKYGPAKTLYPEAYQDGSWDTIYGFKRHWAKVNGGKTDELVRPLPLERNYTIEEIASHTWPEADWFDYGTIKEQCEHVRDYSVIFNIGGLGTIANLIGFERMYTDMYLNADTLKYTLCRISDFFYEFADRIFNAAEGGIDITVIHDDFGMQNGPIMSMEHFREFWKPYLKRHFDLAHSHGIKTMMHSCGAVFNFIPEFIEIGADILDPVQVSAHGMDPAVLAREFGGDICFHGGIDTQSILVSGSPDEIRRHIDCLVDNFSDSGGFILAPSHYIQGDVPTENLIAMFDHIEKIRNT
ncbi:MAG: hypothetical protein HN368_22430 [Spirochaetales bacterium]|jgi:uroporphyrinogen decarboxylase|nr:hypothetical protein [Spirochaetales bacterium]